MIALVSLSLAGLVQLVVLLAIIGVCLHLLYTYVPMAAPIKTLITVVIVLAVCVYLLQFAGLV